MRPLRILLGDLSYFNKYTTSTLYTPLNVAYVATYAKQIFGKDIDVEIFKNPSKLLENAKTIKPDIVGLSLYYWNTSLNNVVIKKIRAMYGNDVIIVYGGASVDTDTLEQNKMFDRFPEVDFLIPNEGEQGVANIIGKVLSDFGSLYNNRIAGVSFRKEFTLIQGESIGLSTDLSNLESPYLNGFMDDFLLGFYQPLLQTSRSCPYTCAFCVSGKNRGKLRKFPLEQVIEEIAFISHKYKDRPHFTLFIADENFGIFPRDIKIAESIREHCLNVGYPRNVFFYNDKSFTKTSKDVVEVLGNINTMGLTIALQTENPDTLRVINRKNLSSSEIDKAISWARNKNIPITTEVIFGLPFETKESFVNLLERSVQRGFDSVLCHNLFIMDGIEMNRDDYRNSQNLKTRFRILGSNYGIVENDFVAETEEVVVSSKTFSFADFVTIRRLNFMFYTIYSLDFYKWFFQYMKEIDVPILEFFIQFMNPNKDQVWPEEYLQFVDDFNAAFLNELFQEKQEAEDAAFKMFLNNGNDVGEPSRLNVLFGSRLIYAERVWINEVLKKCLRQFVDWERDSTQEKLVEKILDICESERIKIPEINQVKPIIVEHDFIAWKKGKFKINLHELRMTPKLLKFGIDASVKERIVSFNQGIKKHSSAEYYYNALDYIMPRSRLLFDLAYDSEGEA